MTRQEKQQVIEELQGNLTESRILYLADTSGMPVELSNKLRKTCYERNVQLRVVKNTLLKIAMEKTEEKDFSSIFDILKGTTAVMFADAANAPAKVIKEFYKNNEKPTLKGAFIDTDTFIGHEQLNMLAAMKSRDELIGDVVGLLQSPIKNVVSALQSGGNTLSGLVKTLENKEK